MSYDDAPQDPHRSIPGIRHVVLDPDSGRPQLYTLEQIIIKAADGDLNCREWLEGEQAFIPRVPADAIPKGHIRCAKCEVWKPIALFSDDSRNKKRYGKHSYCKRCRAKMKFEKERDKMLLRIEAVAAVVAELKAKVT